MYWHAVADTVMCLPFLLFFKERPSNNHVKSSEADADTDALSSKKLYSIKRDMQTLWSNSSYWYFVLFYTILHGVYVALGATVNNMARPFHYTAKESSFLGCLNLVAGITAGFLMSVYLDTIKHNKIRKLLILLNVLSWGSLFSYIGLLFTLKPGNITMVAANIAALGVFNVPVVPIGLFAAAELSQPVSEVLSSGLVITCGCIYGVIMTCVVSMLIDDDAEVGAEDELKNKVKIYFALTIFMVFIACLAIWKVKIP